MGPKSKFENFSHKRYCFQIALLHKKVTGLCMVWMEEYPPPFQGNPWMKAEDPTGLLLAVCVKEEGTIGILGIPVTMPPKAPSRLVGTIG